MEVYQRHQSPALIRSLASAAVALGDLQVLLLGQLAAELKAAGEPAEHTLPLDASIDQLEASVREMRRRMHRGNTGPDRS